MSGVGHVVGATRHAWAVAEATIAEAKTVHGTVESQIASISAHATERAMCAVQAMEGQVQALAAHSDVQVSRVVETVTQRLEGEIQTAATRAATIAKENTRATIEEMRKDLQVQLEKTRTDS